MVLADLVISLMSSYLFSLLLAFSIMLTVLMVLWVGVCAQNRTAGKAPTVLKSVERLASRQSCASAARSLPLGQHIQRHHYPIGDAQAGARSQQTKNELRHFYRIADLVAPVRCQRPDHRATDGS